MFKKKNKPVSLLVLITFLFFPQASFGLPTDGVVVGGDTQATITTSGPTYTVDQNAANVIINYSDFDVNIGETVHFQQDSSSWIALNRVNGNTTSEILGTMSALGKVFLINPNGIIFGAGSMINVGSMIASTLDIADDDFNAGIYSFAKGVEASNGSVINFGALNAPGGYIALLGSSVLNGGAILADAGSVALAAGDAMTVSFDADNMISVAILEGTLSTGAVVNNVGSIQANGGKVLLTAQVVNDLLNSSVNNDGIIEANSLKDVAGEVVLNTNANVKLNGTINAKDGVIDAYAGENITLGGVTDDYTVTSYKWDYVSGSRGYTFTSFGYYYLAADGVTPIYVPLVTGIDIGKDGGVTSGSSMIFSDGDTTLDGLGVTFKDYSNKTLQYYSETFLNGDSTYDHVQENYGGVADNYGWEDSYKWSIDHDFNDAVVAFKSAQTTVADQPTVLTAANIFLTAKNGSITQTEKAMIDATNLMLSANTGITGIALNGGVTTQVDNVSATNKTGDIRIDNTGDLTVKDLTAEVGPNGVAGTNGITNGSGTVNVAVHSNVTLASAIVTDDGDVVLTATTGGILDNDDAGAVDVVSDTLTMNAVDTIGESSNAIETDINELWAAVSDGDIYLNEKDGITLQNVTAQGNSAMFGGDPGAIIAISAGGDILAHQVSAASPAGSPIGVFLTARDGDVTVDGSVTAESYGSQDTTVSITAEQGSIILDDASVSAKTYNPSQALVSLTAAEDITVDHSNVNALSNGQGRAVIALDAGNDVDIVDESTVKAKVDGDGHAEVAIDAVATVTIEESTVKAVSANSPTTAAVSVGAADIDMHNSSVGAISVGGGHSEVTMTGTNSISITRDDMIPATLYAVVFGHGDAEVVLTAGEGGIEVSNETVKAQTCSGDAEVTLTSEGPVVVTNSTIESIVYGEGHAGVYFYNPEATTSFNTPFGTLTLNDFIDEMGGAMAGDITIKGSTVRAQADSAPDARTAVVYMNTDGDISFDNSFVQALETDGIAGIGLIAGGDIDIVNTPVFASTGGSFAGVGMLADDDITVDEYSTVRADADGLAVVAAGAGGSIDAQGYVIAQGGEDGFGLAALGAMGDVYAGNVSASGGINALDMLADIFDMGWLAFGSSYYFDWLGSAALVGSVNGDVTLRNVSADMILAAALGLDGDGSIYQDGAGMLDGGYGYFLARNDIGTVADPLAARLFSVAGYSYDKGDIYIDGYSKIMELGWYLSGCAYDESFYFEAGASLAANNGSVNVSNLGHVVVNSVLAPRGGVFLNSEYGNIYAGIGFDPAVSQADVDEASAMVADALDGLFEIGQDDVAEVLGEALMDLSGTPWKTRGGVDYYSPVMVNVVGAEDEVRSFFDGPNVLAGAQSYFSAAGTIGSGSLFDKGGYSEDVASAVIQGIIRPGVTAETGVYPSYAIDATGLEGINTDAALTIYAGGGNGAMFYDDQESAGIYALFAPVADNVTGMQQVAGVSMGEMFFRNPLKVNIQFGEDEITPTLDLGAWWKDFRAYYEILDIYRVASFLPATPTEAYAYHPLAPADASAFDEIALDEGAYDFIDGTLNMKKKAAYLGVDAQEGQTK